MIEELAFIYYFVCVCVCVCVRIHVLSLRVLDETKLPIHKVDFWLLL
jgi:hypothetical protein